MTRILFTLALSAGIIPTAFATDDSTEEALCEVSNLEWQFERAVVKGDLDFFHQILADDFTHTTQTGKFRNRAQWLANHKAGQSNYDALNTRQLVVHVYGDTAVVTATIQPQGRDSQGKPIEGQYRYLRVWVKHGDTWQVVAFQSTRVTEGEKGSKP